jgi:predicted RNA binding protein YcfA (HicA-like mRNA interferase family)
VQYHKKPRKQHNKGAKMASDIKQLIKTAEKQGWEVRKTNGGHLKWISPYGGFVFSALTPSDNRAIQNIVHQLQTRGFKR